MSAEVVDLTGGKLSTEQVLCIAGIEICNNVLRKWDIRGNKRGDIKVCAYADEVQPQEVSKIFRRINLQLVDGGSDECPDFNLVIFFANAKHGFIMRLAAIQERENAVLMA